VQKSEDRVKDIHELLREKEEELARITQEIEAIRLVARLMAVDGAEKHRPASAAQPAREMAVPGRIKDFP
jgi:hypothetical protein